VLDLDIKGFFDNLPWDLMMKAVRKHAKDPWVVLYIERWLRAPSQDEQGNLIPKEKGTPQGSVISPLLSNLFLHYALDQWMAKHHLDAPFERYADDGAPRAKDGLMFAVLCATTQPMREIKAPRDRLTGAGLKSPPAAVAKSHGRERRRKRPGHESGQMSDREMNASEPLMKCRKHSNEVETEGTSLTRDQHGRDLFRIVRPPALRWHDPVARRLCGTWEPSAPMLTERPKQKTCEGLSREAAPRDGSTRSSDEVSDKGMEPRGRAHEGWFVMSTGNGRN
jgi:hypothetical protein